MRLKNVMIVVKDIEKSKMFYKELFGLDVLMEQEGNVILTEGLVLQEKNIWETCLQKEVTWEHNASLLYFEEKNMERFLERLQKYSGNIVYVTDYTEFPWGQKIVRFYDLDGNLIEVRTPM